MTRLLILLLSLMLAPLSAGADDLPRRVVEELVFQMSPAAVDHFIEHDAAIWTGALSSQAGFLRKEVWKDRKKPGTVALIIHWRTMNDWMRVPKKLLSDTDKAFQAAMGEHTFKMVSSRAYDWEGATDAQVIGESHPEFDLASIDSKAWADKAQEIEISNDPVYHQRKKYRAFPLDQILTSWLEKGAYAPNEWEVEFECEDGYAPTTSLKHALSGDAYLAFADLEASEGADWVPKNKGDGTAIKFAPYYLVWTAKGASERPWPYNLVKLKLTPSAERYRRLEPNDKAHSKGFALYRHHCLRCHAIDGVGGTLGPELHSPRNVTEYWKQDQLVDFIKNPLSFRRGSKMPPMMHLGDQEINQIVGYLSALAADRAASKP